MEHFTFTLYNHQWIVEHKNNKNNYIKGTLTHIESVFVSPEDRNKKYCSIMLEIAISNLESIYKSSGEGLDTENTKYTIDMQGSNIMCKCMLNISKKFNKILYKENGEIVSKKNCLENNFIRGSYYFI